MTYLEIIRQKKLEAMHSRFARYRHFLDALRNLSTISEDRPEYFYVRRKKPKPSLSRYDGDQDWYE